MSDGGDERPAAVVLTGAGARGAYQAGALAALLPALVDDETPLSIFTGSGVGALNALTLAAQVGRDADEAAEALTDPWSRIEPAEAVSSPWGQLPGAVAGALADILPAVHPSELPGLSALGRLRPGRLLDALEAATADGGGAAKGAADEVKGAAEEVGDAAEQSGDAAAGAADTATDAAEDAIGLPGPLKWLLFSSPIPAGFLQKGIGAARTFQSGPTDWALAGLQRAIGVADKLAGFEVPDVELPDIELPDGVPSLSDLGGLGLPGLPELPDLPGSPPGPLAAGLFGLSAPTDGLEEWIDWDRLHELAADGEVQAAAVCASIERPWTTVFLEGANHQPEPQRRLRYAAASLAPEHLAAAMSTPPAMPAVCVREPTEYCGYYVDGSTRLLAPLRPALDLGAQRLIVIATSSLVTDDEPADAPEEGAEPRDAAHILVETLTGRSLIEDVRRLAQINETVDGDQDGADGYDEIPYVIVAPRTPGAFAELALQVLEETRSAMASPRRNLLERIAGTDGPAPGELLSYLPFAPEYLERLIEMGRADAEAWIEADHDAGELWQVSAGD